MSTKPPPREQVGVSYVADPYPDVPGIDPAATCDGCGAIGTVARAARTDLTPATLERYCEQCWPERQQATHESNVPMWWHVESWRNVQSFLAEATTALAVSVQLGQPESERQNFCRGIVAKIHQAEARYEGRMPADVRAFLEKYDVAT